MSSSLDMGSPRAGELEMVGEVGLDLPRVFIPTCETAAPESSAGYAAAARSAPRSLLLGGEQVPAVAVLQAFAKRAKSVVPPAGPIALAGRPVSASTG